MTFETLRALADRAALFTALRQEQLAAATEPLGAHRWDVDLAAGTFTLTSDEDPARTLSAVPHLVASIAPGPRSLKWSWALPQGDRTGVTDALRAYGDEHGIPELTQGEVGFPDDVHDDLDGWTTRLADAIGGAAVEITGRSPHYCASTEGATVVLLLDAPLEPLTVAGAVPALRRVLADLPVNDPRASVWDLGRLAGWHLSWNDESFSAAVATDASGSAELRFDEYGRVTRLEYAER